MDKHLLQARDNIIESAGRTTQGFGLGRIIGQLYALLFFSPKPMSLDDMATELRVSKGSVSTNIRELEKWGAVKQVWVKGSRKDFYLPEINFMRILQGGVIPFFRRKLESSLTATSESKQLIESDKQKLTRENSDLAEFYVQRLNLIEKAREKLALFINFSGI